MSEPTRAPFTIERLVGLPVWAVNGRFREHIDGPRYVEAVRGAPAIREELRAFQWHRAKMIDHVLVYSGRPRASDIELRFGCPPSFGIHRLGVTR